jgi:hypothetical protein
MNRIEAKITITILGSDFNKPVSAIFRKSAQKGNRKENLNNNINQLDFKRHI